MDVALACIFGAWLALSVIGQFQAPKTDALRRYDVLQLLPIWTFFAPNPGSSDYHVIVRDRCGDGTLTEWRDAMPIPAQTVTSWLWNPKKRQQKVLVDAVSSLAELCAPSSQRGIPPERRGRVLLITSPYLVVLNMVVHCVEHAPGAATSQFALVERSSFGQAANPTVLLLSPFHRLGP
ncbi:MAG TPA: hypothetical protein VGE38_06465 [Nocardioides sp.]|uniref:hypothetical protein n=1 Tax=Nocardioides sp. TaxID=35761 RepID=UPI002EDBB5B8